MESEVFRSSWDNFSGFPPCKVPFSSFGLIFNKIFEFLGRDLPKVTKVKKETTEYRMLHLKKSIDFQ